MAMPTREARHSTLSSIPARMQSIMKSGSVAHTRESREEIEVASQKYVEITEKKTVLPTERDVRSKAKKMRKGKSRSRSRSRSKSPKKHRPRHIKKSTKGKTVKVSSPVRKHIKIQTLIASEKPEGVTAAEDTDENYRKSTSRSISFATIFQPDTFPKIENAGSRKQKGQKVQRSASRESRISTRSKRAKTKQRQPIKQTTSTEVIEQVSPDSSEEEKIEKEEPPQRESATDTENIFKRNISRSFIFESISRELKVLEDDGTLVEDVEAEDESDSSSIQSYVKQKPLKHSMDFFERLGDVPSITSISSRISEDEEHERMTLLNDYDGDFGKFVDPLTGHVVLEDELVEPEVSEETIERTSERPGDDIYRFDDFVDEADYEVEDFYDDELEDVEIDMPDMSHSSHFLNVDRVDKETEEMNEIGRLIFEELERQERIKLEDQDNSEMDEAARAEILEHTTKFLQSIIDRAVFFSEHPQPAEFIQKTLDKEEAMQKLMDDLVELEKEKRVCIFLNKKTVDFYRRRRQFRPITETNPQSQDSDLAKYRDAAEHLDNLLGKEKEIFRISEEKILRLNKQLENSGEQMKENIADFEQLALDTLVRDGPNKERMAQIVKSHLYKISMARNEISRTRYLLIERQHTLAALKRKRETLENISEGLTLNYYERLETDAAHLEAKIGERNSDLTKMRLRCNTDIHLLAHTKEKEGMIRANVDEQKRNYEYLVDEKTNTREYLYSLQLVRGRLRKEIHELSFQGGLIDKPALMRDYDVSVEKIDVLQANVDALKKRYQLAEQKIERALKSCNDEFANKF